MKEQIHSLKKKNLVVNGLPVTVLVEAEAKLVDVIRKQLHLTGTKVGCRAGQCGICSVLLDGKVVRSCVTTMKNVRDGAEVTTIEGVGTPANPHPLQLAFIKYGATQCGICTPGFIVSAKGLLDVNPNPTREEVREWFQKNRNACRCTGYKPIVDAVMAAAKIIRGEDTVESLAYRLPADGKIFGTDHPRPSALAKVTGTLDYGADLGLKLPADTLRLALVQAQVSHAKILSIETRNAETMPGVVRVLTYKDVKGTNRINGLVTYPWNKGDGYDRPILCDEKVFQFGDAIAIVCADTEEHARLAAEKVQVVYEELPAYMSAPEAAAEDAIEIHPGTPNVFFEQPTVKGEDPAPQLKNAAVVKEGDYYLQRQPHLALEPDVGFAYFDEEGRLTIHSKSIALYIHIDMIQEGLGIEKENLRIVQNNMGGTFGYKLSPTLEALLGVACMATGKPVYLEYNMYQHITYTGKRSPFFIHLKMGADKEGKLLGMEYDFIVDHGAYSEFGDVLATKGTQFIGAGYKIENIRGMGRATFTNHAFGSAFRAFGSPQSFLASESMMDELAEELGMDPFEFRYKNLYREGDTTPTGCKPDVYVLPQLFDMIRPKYQEAKKRAAAGNIPEKKRGVGISLGIYCVGNDSVDVAAADAELNPDGSVTIYDTWEDHGQGSDMGTLAAAHEALRPLKISPENIKLVMNDTGVCPDSGPAAGSRSQLMVGNAIADACTQLIKAMKKPDGAYRTYEEMQKENIPLRYTGNYATGQVCTVIDQKTGQYDPFVAYMYAVFVSEVEVDLTTGKTQVLKMTIAADVGKIANKLVVDGQIYGGLTQGIGLALSEDFEDLEKHNNLARCGIPYIKDVPDELEIMYIETPRKHSAQGASGVGEVPLTSPHVSILNAINNACGVRVRDLPALPEKILAGLKAN
ncbi:MAG: molybdopterin-dependent oxidoreductase [Spirochaetales bacterium]|nr:molybdopterin-dependent oxidoreductase [Spirochaetales bacterium]